MIIINTNAVLRATFERLLTAMKEPVEWNGQFVAIGDYLILHGRVRSLFFNFESKKLLTNIIDIPVNEDSVVEAGTHAKVPNVLNMALYAFGKWGLIRGVKVEHDYVQLNELFGSVLQEIGASPDFSGEQFRFYKEGIRISYEDVVQMAIEASEASLEEAKHPEPASEGLWHDLVWKRQNASFGKSDTTFDERQKERQGNSFYMVGYLCPKCRGHLHMAAFPKGREFRIETEEGGVLLARAYACETCLRFYTPRPEKLLEDGDVYQMDFEGDGKAYEDYMDLLGERAERVSNYGMNQYADPARQKAAEASGEAACADAGEREEAFPATEEEARPARPAGAPRETAAAASPVTERGAGGSLAKESARTKGAQSEAFRAGAAETAVLPKEAPAGASAAALSGSEGTRERDRAAASTEPARPGRGEAGRPAGPAGASAASAEPARSENGPAGGERESAAAPREIPAHLRQAAKKRFTAKCNVLDRLSFEQISELKRDLRKDRNLNESDKEPFLRLIAEREEQKKTEHVRKLADGCRGGSYSKIRRAVAEIEKTEIRKEEKDALLAPLYEEKKRRGEAEVAEMMEKLPRQMDLAQCRRVEERLREYPEVDLSPYEEMLDEKKRQAESVEIANMIRHSRTGDRQGLADLAERLKKQQFHPETLDPYLKKLDEKIRRLDEEAIAEICGDPANRSVDETAEAYRKISEGEFLPELKSNALEMLKKRLAKLKMDECELLVRKLEESMSGRINKNGRHHFYPARRIQEKEASPEEYKTIQYALDTYGTTRELFEYPIFVVDTSRDRSGKEGMLLTPERLFYKTMMGAYVVPVKDIRRVSGQASLFHGALSLEFRDGAKVKIPYAVDKKELTAWGNCLDEFIHYLQEKPDSRNLSYLVKEKHEQICCFRCGYSYKGTDVCPKCGYKRNQ